MNDKPSREEIEFIRNSLNKYNFSIVGNDNHELLNLIEYNENGEIIAGLLGGTYWGWLYIDILFVSEKYREKGLGSKLLKEAENIAISRGCHHVHVDTMSWQAPLFYKKHGYKIEATLPDIPTGNNKYLLIKNLNTGE